MNEPKQFPILLDYPLPARNRRRLTIPWEMIAPHEAQAKRNHDQTLERLAYRGGLSPREAVAVIQGVPFRDVPEGDAEERLEQLVKAFESAEKGTPKHTPGPWTAERHGGVTAVVDGRRVQVAAAMGQGPMYGPSETDVVAIQSANARLIAAAPELLEALRCLQAAIVGEVNGIPNDLKAQLDRASAVIATAEARP